MGLNIFLFLIVIFVAVLVIATILGKGKNFEDVLNDAFNSYLQKKYSNQDKKINFNIEGSISKDHLLYFKKFKKIKFATVDKFNISASFENNSFCYYQLRNYFTGNSYSVLFLDTDKYEQEFASLSISPNKKVYFGKKYDLEWIKFNKYFISKFDNPRQALEVVNPSFMERLAKMKEKYKEIYIEYFESREYQKHCLVIYKKGIIFPYNFIELYYKNNLSEGYFDKFIEFLSESIDLNKSI